MHHNIPNIIECNVSYTGNWPSALRLHLPALAASPTPPHVSFLSPPVSSHLQQPFYIRSMHHNIPNIIECNVSYIGNWPSALQLHLPSLAASPTPPHVSFLSPPVSSHLQQP